MSIKFRLRAAGAISFGVLALLCTQASAQNVDTTAVANDCFNSFGTPDTATFGQTITIAGGTTGISSFGFEMQTIPATVAFRGEVYAWDSVNNRATGPALYESGIRRTSGATRQLVTFTPASPVAVTVGRQYVLFATTSRDQPGNAGGGCWDANFVNNVYTGGEAVYINNGTNVGWWTTEEWNRVQDTDFGFSVDFVAAPAVPTLSEWAMILFGTILAGGSALLIQRRRQSA